MNANTLKAVAIHGETLINMFPNATERRPVALCKKLRRIENAVSKPILDYANGDNGMTIEKLDAIIDKATSLLGCQHQRQWSGRIQGTNQCCSGGWIVGDV